MARCGNEFFFGRNVPRGFSADVVFCLNMISVAWQQYKAKRAGRTNFLLLTGMTVFDRFKRNDSANYRLLRRCIDHSAFQRTEAVDLGQGGCCS